MKKLLLSTLLLAGCAHVQAGNDAAESLVAAERAFAADATARPVHDAFLGVLADDAVIFRPTPVNARQALRERPMNPQLLLEWTPIYAEVSTDGTFGFTTGPSNFGRRGQPPAGTGYFVSVWRRTGSKWQLVADGGIECPIPGTLEEAARQLRTGYTSKSGPNVSADQRELALQREDEQLASFYETRFPEMADRDVRVMRDGHTPVADRSAGIVLVRQDPDIEFEVTKVAVSPANDFGYVLGRTNPKSDKPGSFLRIYRRDTDRNWRIAVDWRS